MDTLIFIVCIFALFPVYRVFRKFLNNRDITIFDIHVLALFLFFTLIPVYYYIQDNKYSTQLINGPGGDIALIVGLVITYLFSIIDKIFVTTKKYNTSLLNLSCQFRRFYHNFSSFQSAHAILLCIYVGLMFISVTFISNKNGDDLTDTDQEHLYTKATTIQESIDNKLRTVYIVFYPVTIICAITILKKSKNRRLRTYSKICIVIALLCYIQTSRTHLTAVLVFVMLYLYSINQKKIKIIQLLKISGILGFLFSVFFPLFQIWRFTKANVLTENTSAGVLDILETAYYNLDRLDMLSSTVEQTTGRSLNLFRSLVYSINNANYYGWCFFKSVTNIFPGRDSLESNVEFQLAVAYEGYGVDISDSILMFSIADFGLLGILFSLIYYYIFIKSYLIEERIFRKYNFNLLFTLAFEYNLFIFMFIVENAPYWSIRNLIYTTFVGCIINAFLLKLLNKKSKIIYV